MKASTLAPEAEILDQLGILIGVCPFEIILQTPPPPDKSQQAPTRSEILLMLPQVRGQITDVLGQDRNLRGRRTRIPLATAVLAYQFFLILGCDGQFLVPPSN